MGPRRTAVLVTAVGAADGVAVCEPEVKAEETNKSGNVGVSAKC